MDTVEKRLLKVIALNYGDADITRFTDATSLVDELGLDSLAVVELIQTIEDEFEIEIPDDDLNEIITLGNMIEYITGRLDKES